MTYDVIILGGGCGGLWLLHEFSRKGYCALLLEDAQLLGRFGSTRGQNRLHTGALYVLAGDPSASQLVNACQKGYRALRSFCDTYVRNGVQLESDCVYAFTTADSFEIARQRLSKMADDRMRAKLIAGRKLKTSGFDDVRALIPSVRSCIVTDEVTFHAHRILTALAAQCRRLGGRIEYAATRLRDLSFSRVGSAWGLGAEEGLIAKAPIIVCAAGVSNPEIMQRLYRTQGEESDEQLGNTELEWKRDKSLVVVFHRRICGRIISLQDAELVHHISLMPVEGVTTMTTGATTRPIRNSDDDEPWLADQQEMLEEALSYCLPGLREHFPCAVHVYACQKLDNFDHKLSPYPGGIYGKRHYFWVESQYGGSVFFFSPGKFTIASVAAEEFVKWLEGRGSVLSKAELVQGEDCRASGLAVATPACVGRASYLVRELDGRVRFGAVGM